MRFDWRTFLALKWCETRTGAHSAAWALTAVQALTYPMTHLAFAADDVLYPGIRRVSVKKPTFVVGFPRSGTTLLFRLLAADPTAATYDFYRMIFPSVALRRWIPEWVVHRFGPWIESWLSPLDSIHPIRLHEPEEDEVLFFLLGSSAVNAYLFPYGETADRTRISRFWEWLVDRRKRHMIFYHRCIKRILWESGAQRYIGKSPHYLGKIRPLFDRYPDARFIYIVRSPFASIPSTLSMITAFWNITCRGPVPSLAIEQMYRDLVAMWAHGDREIQILPEENKFIVRYDDLIRDPGRIMRTVYDHCNLELPDSIAVRLDQATHDQRSWRSRHHYTLRDFPFDRDRIRADLATVIARHNLEE